MRKYIHIGCGNWGQTWLNRIIPQTADIGQCVAAVDINGEAVRKFGAALGLPENAVYTSVDEALKAHEVDYVTIAAAMAWIEGGPEPDTSLRNSLAGMAIGYAAVESNITGKPVSVREVMRRSGLDLI